MIWSGLPYSQEDIEKAYNEGADVDMSKVSFPNCKTLEENYSAALIYLRNTDYNVNLHFENMTYLQKSTLLKVYMNTKIKYDIPVLDSTLLAVMFACSDIKKKELDCILNDLELITFVAEQFQFCYDMWELVASLPLYAISRLEEGGKPVASMSEVPTTDKEPNTVTLINMMKLPEFDDLYTLADQIKPVFYTKLFTVENTELFEAMTNLSFMVVLHGLVTETPEKYKEFLQDI